MVYTFIDNRNDVHPAANRTISLFLFKIVND